MLTLRAILSHSQQQTSHAQLVRVGESGPWQIKEKNLYNANYDLRNVCFNGTLGRLNSKLLHTQRLVEYFLYIVL